MQKRFSNKKRFLQIIAVLATAAVIVSLPLILPFRTNAVEYDETNPELTEGIIDSNVEVMYTEKVPYTPYAHFVQGNGSYSIDTDAYVVWYQTDDVAFLYREYEVGNTNKDVMTWEATINTRQATNPGSALNSTASGGLMIRESMDPDAPQIFLHAREEHVCVVFRTEKGGDTYVTYGTPFIKPDYPVQLRIEKTGKKYVLSYNQGEGGWQALTAIGMEMDGPLLAGVAAHCSQKSDPITCTFSNYSAKGTGIVADDEGESTEPEILKPSMEDAPITEDTLLIETFTDGSITLGEQSVSNWIWEAPTATAIEEREGGNRLLHSEFADGKDFLGSEEWTDYSVSIDFELGEATQVSANDALTFWVRHKSIDFYGYAGVGLRIDTPYDNVTGTHSTRISVVTKNRAIADNTGTVEQSVDVEDIVGTGMHNFYAECFDDRIDFYLDGKLLMSFEEEEITNPRLRGNIGFETASVDAWFDNITVKKLEDPLGGDYDNYIGGNFNDPIPDYILDFEAESGAIYTPNNGK